MPSLPAHIRTLDWLRGQGRGLPGVVIGSGARHLRGGVGIPHDIDVLIPCSDVVIGAWLSRLRRNGWQVYAWRRPVSRPVSSGYAHTLFYLRALHQDQQLDVCLRLAWAGWGQVRRLAVRHSGVFVLPERYLRRRRSDRR